MRTVLAAVAPALSVVLLQQPSPPSALPSPSPPGRTFNPIRTAVVSFVCAGVDASAPPVQRMKIDLSAMLLIVEAAEAGGMRTESYSIDTNMDIWLGGRNRRDPRLGFVLTQSRGKLRLDGPSGVGLRALPLLRVPLPARRQPDLRAWPSIPILVIPGPRSGARNPRYAAEMRAVRSFPGFRARLRRLGMTVERLASLRWAAFYQ